MNDCKILLFLLILSVLGADRVTGLRGEEQHDIGTLAGDVQNWAMLIQNYILQVNEHTYILFNF